MFNFHYDDFTASYISTDSKLPEICRALGLPELLQANVAFLKECIIVIAPLAASLDILPGDKHTSLCYILPTLTVLIKEPVGRTAAEIYRGTEISCYKD